MKWETVTSYAMGAGAAVLGLLGGWDNMLFVLIVFMALDYVTGVLVAARNRSLKTETGGINSNVGFVGLMKKAGILGVVMLTTHLDLLLGDLGMTGALARTATMMFFIANEGISVLENAGRMGIPLPAQLTGALEQLKGKDKSNA